MPARKTVRIISRQELPADTVTLARWLIGKALIRDSAEGTSIGRIVETEAYLVGDASSHAFKGVTGRNRAMFLERGHAYVYFIYGTWFCMNVTSEAVGVGAAVLVRALEPLSGIELMEQRRGTIGIRDLARGPGRLAQAMDIDARLDGADLCAAGPLRLGHVSDWLGEIGESKRIGITKEADRILRFYARGSDFVSGSRAMRS